MHCVPQLEDVISAIRLLQLVELLSTQGGKHREERNRADKQFAPNATPPCNECARQYTHWSARLSICEETFPGSKSETWASFAARGFAGFRVVGNSSTTTEGLPVIHDETLMGA